MKPTESELEILLIIWNLGDCTVRTVHDELIKSKDVGYTSTLKLMQNMYDKRLVSRSENSRSHIYKAVLTREQAQDSVISKVINTIFNGSTAELVMKALGQHTGSPVELNVIKDYLKKITKNK